MGWRRNLYSIWIAQFIASVGISMVIPFLPFYVRELGVTGDESVRLWSGLVFAAPYLVSALMQPLWGILGDRHGRKPMVVRAMLGLALANTLMGFAQNVTQLLALRFLQGTLSGFLAPSLALVASSTPPEKTGMALGTLQSGMVTGMIVGPVVGGVLAHLQGCRPIFIWTGVFCFAAALIVVRFVRENFVPVPERRKSELVRNIRSVFESRELRGLFLILIMVQFAIHFVAPFLSLYVEFLNFPQDCLEIMTGFVFAITGITSAATSPLWGKRGDRVGYAKVLRASLVGIVLFVLPQAFVTSAYQLLFFRAGLGIFVSGTVPTINAIVQRSTSERERGGIYGIFQSGYLIGNMAGPLLGGALAALMGLRSIFIATSIILCAAIIYERRSNTNN